MRSERPMNRAKRVRYAERSEGIARRAEQAVQRCTAERRKPFGGNLAEGDPKDAQAGAWPMCGNLVGQR